MAKSKLKTREELTVEYIEKFLNRTGSIESMLKEVRIIVDEIMKAREVDMTGEFYVAVEKELGSE